MESPFRLTRRDRPAATDALFVAPAAVADLLTAVRAVPGGWPHTFRAAGGFVIVPAGLVPPSIPLAIRLRRLAGDLYLPADADLLPALLPDEAVGLTRDRGLVFLPGGTVLAFDPAKPLRESDVLAVGPVCRGEWQPFPERPAFADQLHTIRVETPPTVAVEILTAGEPDDREPLGGEPGADVPEDARPPSGSLARRASAGAKLGGGSS